MAQGVGFGKVILFGEHFVVYGCEAIVSAIDKKTTVSASKTESELKINSIEKDLSRSYEMVKAILSKMELDESVELNVDSTIPVGAGLGSSAAFNVATVKALNKLFKKNLSPEKISETAFEGEKVAHGNPSGIDNTIATFGGLLFFKKNLEGGKNFIERFKIKELLKIVIGNSGKQGNTKELVTLVREKKQAKEEWFEKIFSKEQEIVLKAKGALLHNNLVVLGKLMYETHQLLKEIGVSTEELEKLVQISIENGAFGAKITGAGGGGCVIALTPTEKVQEKVAGAMEKNGFESYKTLVGV